MRALILSCNTGEGHNSCAKAIQESFQLHGQYCVIDDVLRFVSKGFSALISKAHIFMYRHVPSLFRHGYRYVEQHERLYDEHSAVHRILLSGSDRLLEFIRKEQFDAVICTHPLAVIILNAVIEKGNITLQTSFVATDYTCSPTVEAGELGIYFIPDDSLKDEFVEYGIAADKIVSSGIPVQQMFFASARKEDAKKIRGIDPGHNHLLVICGSMGCGPVKKLVSIIAEGLSENTEMTVVCGTNNRLRRYLERKHGNNKNIHICGYEKNMSGLLDSADVYLTKPGGLSITEAKTKCLPMVFINAVAGCEAYNQKFFIDRGAAVSADNVYALAKQCFSLLQCDETQTHMRIALENIQQNNAAEFIYNQIAQSMVQ